MVVATITLLVIVNFRLATFLMGWLIRPKGLLSSMWFLTLGGTSGFVSHMLES